MKIFCLLVTVIQLVKICENRLFMTQNLPMWKMLGRSDASGEELILTDHVEQGDDVLARRLARVDRKYFLGVTSFSGYLTVNQEHNSNLFFWFFPAQGTEHLYEDDEEIDDDSAEVFDSSEESIENIFKYFLSNKNTTAEKTDWKNENKPVVLWLQGGPGSSSLFGLFTENGPFFVNEDEISIRKNPYSWHKEYSVLFIDNPAGTGFSFTDPDGYCTNITQVAKELYVGLVQFFKMFPQLQENDFFITGESFAGKYIPAIGYEIQQQNKLDEFQINLKGLALGNALSDPYNMLAYGDFAYQTGLVDEHGWREMKIFEYLAKESKGPEGKIYWDAILYTFIQHSNYTNVYNILEPQIVPFDTYLTFMNLPHIRNTVHVGKQEFSPPGLVYFNLIPDFMTTAIHWTEQLLNEGMRIMYYSGNMDLIVAYPLSEEAYKHMKWNGYEVYRQATRKPFVVNGTIHGYIKQANNFADVVILNAGHMVPTDQPIATLELMRRFFKNIL